MSMKRVAMRITLPGLVNDFLHELMDEIGLNKSDLLEAMVFFVSMPDNLEDFKNQYVLGDAGEDDEDDDVDEVDEEEEEEEEEEEDDDDDEDW